MGKKEMLDIYSKALEKWGEGPQIMMLFEECGELLNAMSKITRGRGEVKDVITELADVSIMVEQIGLLLGYEDFEKEKEKKLKRLKSKLKEHNENEND